jgi:2-phospho-L-lactate guanylyltransferase
MILVPVKDFANAKSRLAPVLSRAEREQLARAMFANVLNALCEARHPLLSAARPAAIGIVTRDPEAIAMAQQICPAGRYEIVHDEQNAGETEAIAAATQGAIARGAKFTLVIPGDAPLVTAAEIEQVLDAAPAEGTVLAPARDGEGTNAILRRPGDLFPLRFGNHSFAPHVCTAQATGKPVVILHLAGVALDIDRPEDLAALAAAAGELRAQRLVRDWRVAKRAHPGRWPANPLMDEPDESRSERR